MDKSGIYTFTNLLDGKILVGYATNFRKRKGAHLSNLRKNKHKNMHLQNAWNLYGEENFKVELLEEYEPEFLPSMENWWCNMLDTHNPLYGYNILPTSDKGIITHSQETKDKISNKVKGKKKSKEHCKNIGLSKTGAVPSEVTKDKIKVSIHDVYKKGVLKLNEEKVLTILKLIKEGIKTSKIAKLFEIDRHSVSNIKSGKSWSFVTGIKYKNGL